MYCCQGLVEMLIMKDYSIIFLYLLDPITNKGVINSGMCNLQLGLVVSLTNTQFGIQVFYIIKTGNKEQLEGTDILLPNSTFLQDFVFSIINTQISPQLPRIMINDFQYPRIPRDSTLTQLYMLLELAYIWTC